MFFSRGKVDKPLAMIVITLALFGVVMVYSASSVVAAQKYGDSMLYLKKAIIRVAIGVVVMIVASNIDYRKLSKYSLPLLIISVVPLLMTLFPALAGKGAVKGASRWVSLVPGQNTSFQPSELVKIALIIYLANYLTKKQMYLKDFKQGLLPAIAVPGIIVAIIILQPNFGMAISIMTVCGLMIWVAGAKTKHLALLASPGIPGLVILLLNSDHARKRIMSFIAASPDPQSEGFQIMQSLIAFGNGGLHGVGIGAGRQKHFYLPEAHTDFIFSVVGEELGFVGAIIVVLLFAWLLWRGIKIAMQVEDRFASYLVFGLTSMITVFAVLNLFVVTRLMPTTGIPLPFISYGGTALVVNMLAVGIILNISKNIGVRQPQRAIVQETDDTKVTQSIFISRRGHRRTYNSGMPDSTVSQRELRRENPVPGRKERIGVDNSPKVGV